MIHRCALVALTVVLLGACGSGGASGERQVLVDYTSDEFASFIAHDFPARVEITPGQTVVWKQTWTGEPHTVTGGKLVNGDLAASKQLFTLFNGYTDLQASNGLIDPENAGDAMMPEFFAGLKRAKPVAKRNEVIAAWKAVQKAHPELPNFDHPPAMKVSEMNDMMDNVSSSAFDRLLFAHDDNGEIAQNVGQRCFLKRGAPPKQSSKACTTDEHRQPEFDGTHSFYNSGVLPYSGPRGNTYRVKFAATTKPGTYYFYCAVHGPNQLSEVVVRPKGTKVASPSAVARAGRKDAKDAIAPLAKVFRTATRTGKLDWNGTTLKEPFAGLSSPIEASINEFVPRTLQVKANEPITWNVVGADHTISFNVPPYLPIMQFRSNGKVVLNPKVRDTAGGAPEPPQSADQNSHEPRKLDAGTYDGKGFWSSGVIGGDPYTAYTLRISKKGTYNYACLIHPRMIGKVVVS